MLDRLEALIDVGLELAQAQLRQALAEEDAATAAAPPAARRGARGVAGPAALALAHARVARAIRQAMALHHMIATGSLALDFKAPAEAAGRSSPLSGSPARPVGVFDEEDAFEEALLADWERESEHDDPRELRLEDLRRDLDLVALARRPVATSVEAICRDLGVTFDAALWGDAPAPEAPGDQTQASGPVSRLAFRQALLAGASVGPVLRPEPVAPT
ncbi:MAG: hypothetical protein JSR86_04785 [Proteobacteria bacterium]|nr:hypothetical protein [Pseudomonadota bacterium]